MKDLSQQILLKMLRQTGMACLVFGRDLHLAACWNADIPFFEGTAPEPYRQEIWEVFPELVGNEEAISRLLNGKSRSFVLERVGRTSAQGVPHFYDLRFSLLKSERGPLLLAGVVDVTEVAAREQQARQQEYELRLLRTELLAQNQFLQDSILGDSPAIQKVRHFVAKIAPHDTTVLLQGESGTGKSLVARVIHRASPRARGPFVEINCAAIPAALMESELFGYEKGAFTSAMISKKGLLEEAEGGTLFLDEIGDMPLSLQAKLLTFLEMRTFRRLGSTDERTVDVRLIAATNRDLRQAVAEKAFRQDLYYRINVVSLTLPPLRELGEDVVLLAYHFIHLLNFDLKKHIRGLTAAARRLLTTYDWPGNVRELRNVIERAMIFAEGDRIDADDLILQENAPPRQNTWSIPEGGLSLEEVEKQLLTNALRKTDGNQSRAAALVGLSLDTFRYRLKKYGISPQTFRRPLM